LFAATIFSGAVDPAKPLNNPTFRNALANEKSPYLLQHASNPVEWYPWGEEAFAKARREQKPIFLSVGYSTCHWCHVMAHESFENPAIAKLMNESFVNVKVDREERPDVDRVYMTFVQATTGGGGWPMSVFLTPDLKPFLGGTYYPPEDRFGRPGFPTVLRRIADAWKNDRANVVEHSDTVLTQLREYAAATPDKSAEPGADNIRACLNQLTRTFDDELGGFGDAPKFPRPVALNLLFRVFAREGRESRDGKAALGMALETLRKMAAGGMHDHLGGGFHRYSVDRFWHVPHFEKMLYDQAQLACSYADAFQITRTAEFETIARDILDYVRRDMTDPAGGFYCAEDADSLLASGGTAHAEGAFYVWTKSEIGEALGEEAAALFNRFYGVEEKGNAPEGSDPQGEFTGKNILIQRMTLADAAKFSGRSEAQVATTLAESRAKLLALRSKRPRPHLDDKIMTAWNGLMISGFARAAQVFDDADYLKAAQRSARFVREKLVTKDGQLRRSFRQGAGDVPGFADDYAFFIQGLLDLYESDFDIEWLRWAVELQHKQDTLFWDDEQGGYFSVSGTDPTILIRMKEDYDGAEPSPNSVAALNLLRLSQMTGESALANRAKRTIAAFSQQLANVPSALPQMLCAVDAAGAKPRQVVFAGTAEQVRPLSRELHRHFIPNKIVLLAGGGDAQAWLAQRLEFLKTVTPMDGKAAAYVCEDFVCKLPTTDPAKLRELLQDPK
jgi:uncharacterized protein YyaL (SSP411 family)